MPAFCVKLLVPEGPSGADKVVDYYGFRAGQMVACGEIFTAFSTTKRQKRIKPKVAH